MKVMQIIRLCRKRTNQIIHSIYLTGLIGLIGFFVHVFPEENHETQQLKKLFDPVYDGIFAPS